MSPEYQQFWQTLNNGESISDQFRRIAKGGAEIWIHGSYNPIRDAAGKVYKVVKFATDITEQKVAAHDLENAMNETQMVLQAVAKQDLYLQVNGDYHGRLGELKGAVNTTITSLRDIVMNIQHGAKEVASRAAEISEGNNTLSDRTLQQAGALEKTASSVEEMASSIQQNADNSRQANQLASDAREQAEDGGQVVKLAIEAMSGITASSNKISDIIGVIDEIAFQTNLLALNAAVEAARAGDAGRGFAVVAGEVRTLAGRSSDAAKEIKHLINTSVENVEQGSKLVDESGDALNDIVNSVQKVGDIIAEIAAACQQQSAGIQQINSAINSMDDAVQQNTALVEETSAASASLSDEASDMNDMVDTFNLCEVEVRQRRPRKPPQGINNA